jgi:hypothetical protein
MDRDGEWGGWVDIIEWEDWTDVAQQTTADRSVEGAIMYIYGMLSTIYPLRCAVP